MPETVGMAFRAGFLGNAPEWCKLTVFAVPILNPLLLIACGAFVTGWVLLEEFILTLPMALSCYPLPSGGLMALQAVLLGLTPPNAIYKEVSANLPVLLLLIFMVAEIYFVQELLQTVFTQILLGIRSTVLLSFVFCATSAFLSAFLDALGFIANRLAMGLYREAVDLVMRGVCSVEDVDKAVCFGPELRYALMGPNLIYHLGGGSHGIQGLLKHVWPSLELWGGHGGLEVAAVWLG